MENTTHRIICIHGTLFTKEKGVGDSWWQKKSRFWHALSAKLDISEANSPSHLFRWSGSLDALEWNAGGQALLLHLSKLEKQNTPYHLIAHSHGGNVVWQMLRIAEWQVQRKGLYPLECLQSITTIGTPFLQFSKLPFKVSNTLEVLLPIAILSCFFFPLWINFGWWALLSVLSVPIVFLVSTLALYSVKLAALTGFDDRIAKRYKNSWLSIWSRDDEIVNALRSALLLARKPKSRVKPSPLVSREHSNSWVSFVLLPHTAVTWILNWLIKPKIVSTAAQKALGVRSLRFVLDVDPWPCVQLAKLTEEPIASVRQSLRVDADSKLAEVVPELRNALKSLSYDVDLNLIRQLLSPDLSELVHNSYFQHEWVQNRIIRHITERAPAKAEFRI